MTVGASLKGGAIQLTYVDGATALLTVRGKDHDLDEAELDVLGDTMKAAAKRARAAAKAEALVATLEAAPQREAAPSRMSDLADPGPPLPAWVELVLPSKVGGS